MTDLEKATRKFFESKLAAIREGEREPEEHEANFEGLIAHKLLLARIALDLAEAEREIAAILGIEEDPAVAGVIDEWKVGEKAIEAELREAAHEEVAMNKLREMVMARLTHHKKGEEDRVLN